MVYTVYEWLARTGQIRLGDPRYLFILYSLLLTVSLYLGSGLGLCEAKSKERKWWGVSWGNHDQCSFHCTVVVVYFSVAGLD